MSKAKTTLTVVVADGRYDMFAPVANYKTWFLSELIKRKGGVSDTVPDGIYNFYIVRLTLHGLELNLEPAKTE